MRNYIVKVVCAIVFTFSFGSCNQKITVKESNLTGINPVSYTDVIYKSKRDTVLISTFDGRISEIINDNENNNERLIIDLNDEIYSLAYNANANLIYASTLNRGIVVINELKGKVKKILPLKEKWASYIYYNNKLNLIATSDYGNNSYLWDETDNYSQINIPKEIARMSPKSISNEGVVYFDGSNEIGIWDSGTNSFSKLKLNGKIVDHDEDDNILSLYYDKFLVYNISQDSLLYQGKHPDWPIYVKEKDTIFRAPVNLPLTDAIITSNKIYTSGIDRSIRVWDKKNGSLDDEFLIHKASISAMDISKDETQLVSVDLKGGIKFWKL